MFRSTDENRAKTAKSCEKSQIPKKSCEILAGISKILRGAKVFADFSQDSGLCHWEDPLENDGFFRIFFRLPLRPEKGRPGMLERPELRRFHPPIPLQVSLGQKYSKLFGSFFSEIGPPEIVRKGPRFLTGASQKFS